MRHTSSLATLILGLGFLAVSEARADFNYKVGPVLGYTRASISGTPSAFEDSLNGGNSFSIGGTSRFQLAEKFEILANLTLDIESITGGAGTNISRKQKFLTLPVVARFISGNLSAGAGFSFNYGLSVKDYSGMVVQRDGFAANSLKKSTLGLVVMVGYQIPIQDDCYLTLDAILASGLTNQSSLIANTRSVKRRNLGVMVGYLF